MSLPINNVRRVTEGEFVNGIAAWLRGEDWRLDEARFAPYHRLSIRLRAEGDTLSLDGVPILTRSPAAIMPYSPEHPADNATARSEARALCAVALRGDEGMYGRLPAQEPQKTAA